jgi:hypothetical protein
MIRKVRGDKKRVVGPWTECYVHCDMRSPSIQILFFSVWAKNPKKAKKWLLLNGINGIKYNSNFALYYNSIAK